MNLKGTTNLARFYARTFYVLLAIYLAACFAHGAGWIHVEAIHGAVAGVFLSL